MVATILMHSETKRAEDGQPPFDYRETTTSCSECGKVLGVNRTPWYGIGSAGWGSYGPHSCLVASERCA